jgi:hypothetical protein
MKHSFSMARLYKYFIYGIISGALLVLVFLYLLNNKSKHQETTNLTYKKTKGDVLQQHSDKNKERVITRAGQQHEKKVPLQKLNFLSDLMQNQKINSNVFLIDRNGKFRRSFKELFELTDLEIAEIENKIAGLRQDYNYTILEKAEISEMPGLVTFKISPMEKGADYYDKFMDLMEKSLGPSRFPAFMQLAKDQYTMLFNSFGAEYRTIEFSYTGARLSEGQINVVESYTTGGGIGRQWFTIENVEEFRKRYVGYDIFINNF